MRGISSYSTDGSISTSLGCGLGDPGTISNSGHTNVSKSRTHSHLAQHSASAGWSGRDKYRHALPAVSSLDEQPYWLPSYLSTLPDPPHPLVETPVL